ncbi:type VI secretion system baseplate subunit TssF [Prosthecobacter sp. SYSU 5D2]|uniref:type VI secretion system baseplate subunit TssF n=1 Tax=Prosthecobacter sp. SYSU 5D2 TaxID=3134134 RepID=UPI0031FE887B
MNRAFLELYNEELRHIRERAAEFAASYPKIAGRLALDKEARDACPDPFVERLLEGFAYLAARVQLKLEAEFPRFTQGILETVYPDYMAPWPSATIVRLEPKWNDKALMEGALVPRGTRLNSLRLKEESTTCTFVTSHDVRLCPFKIEETKKGAEYHTRTVGELNVAKFCPNPRAALRIRLQLHAPDDQSISQVDCDRLVFYIHGEDHLPATVLEEIFAHAQGVLLCEPGDVRHRHSTWLTTEALEHVGFAENESMLPVSPRSFEGHRILREHFMLPQRNLFFAIKGVKAALARLPGREVDLIIPLAERKENMVDFVSGKLFQLNCTPAINLFPKRSDRVPISPGFTEYQVVMDRLRMLDYEVHTVLEVNGYGRTSSEEQKFHPFYLRPAHHPNLGGFYSVNRLQRTLSENEKKFGAKSTYAGSEVFLTLVDPTAAPFSPKLEQLGITALCTNRHLPLSMPKGIGETDFIPEEHLPVRTIRCLAGPTVPRPSFAEGRHAWRAISHLSLNYLSLVEKGPDGAESLRQLLRLYTLNLPSQTIIDGILGIESKPSLARSPGGGPVVFIRGIDITLTLDEDRYAGSGIFPLASVLDQFLARQVSLNSFTRLTLKTAQRKEVMSWPPRVGKIPIV